MNLMTIIYFAVIFLVLLWCTGIVAAPVLKSDYKNQSANLLYSFYSRVCHQQDAHSFHIGSEKFGVCIRCTAIYFSFLLCLILMPLMRLQGKINLPNSNWLIIAFIPMIIDVVFNFIGVWTSTVITRLITGFIFGFVTPLYIFPLLIHAISQIMKRKKNIVNKIGETIYVRETK